MDSHVVEAAGRIRSHRYAGADVVLAAGSLVRGEGTPFSDLDLVVVYERLDHAYRESFRFDGLPVEAFVHDPSTLEYFFLEVDVPSGIPSLPQMVIEGVEVPGPTALSRALKTRAAAIVAAGPPALDDESERRMRYFVSDLLDDLRAPRSRHEAVGAGARLYEQLATYVLRQRGLWAARGKAIPLRLRHVDAGLGDAYCTAFAELFASGDAGQVIRLAEDLLGEAGGPLFDGFRIDAPTTWKRQPPE
jgi:Nucleotidyltransferase domain